jgi:hypothetical protein
MKTQINDTSDHGTASPTDQRAARGCAHAARIFEHRNERRKIREQLKRLDWVLDAEDKIERWRRLDYALNVEEEIIN